MISQIYSSINWKNVTYVYKLSSIKPWKEFAFHILETPYQFLQLQRTVQIENKTIYDFNKHKNIFIAR